MVKSTSKNTKQFSKDKEASLTLTLKADSGYECSETCRVSADQWSRINDIINEEDED
jgi:hypothetical protein